MVSHRSGETTDAFIADLAVATGCGQLKSGVPARGEWVAMCIRLVEIEDDTGLPYGQLTIGLQGPPSTPEILHPRRPRRCIMEPTVTEERS